MANITWLGQMEVGLQPKHPGSLVYVFCHCVMLPFASDTELIPKPKSLFIENKPNSQGYLPQGCCTSPTPAWDFGDGQDQPLLVGHSVVVIKTRQCWLPYSLSGGTPENVRLHLTTFLFGQISELELVLYTDFSSFYSSTEGVGIWHSR